MNPLIWIGIGLFFMMVSLVIFLTSILDDDTPAERNTDPVVTTRTFDTLTPRILFMYTGLTLTKSNDMWFSAIGPYNSGGKKNTTTVANPTTGIPYRYSSSATGNDIVFNVTDLTLDPLRLSQVSTPPFPGFTFMALVSFDTLTTRYYHNQVPCGSLRVTPTTVSYSIGGTVNDTIDPALSVDTPYIIAFTVHPASAGNAYARSLRILDTSMSVVYSDLNHVGTVIDTVLNGGANGVYGFDQVDTAAGRLYGFLWMADDADATDIESLAKTLYQDCFLPVPSYNSLYTLFVGIPFEHKPTWLGLPKELTSADAPFSLTLGTGAPDTTTGTWSGTPDTATEGITTFTIRVDGNPDNEVVVSYRVVDLSPHLSLSTVDALQFYYSGKTLLESTSSWESAVGPYNASFGNSTSGTDTQSGLPYRQTPDTNLTDLVFQVTDTSKNSLRWSQESDPAFPGYSFVSILSFDHADSRSYYNQVAAWSIRVTSTSVLFSYGFSTDDILFISPLSLNTPYLIRLTLYPAEVGDPYMFRLQVLDQSLDTVLDHYNGFAGSHDLDIRNPINSLTDTIYGFQGIETQPGRIYGFFCLNDTIDETLFVRLMRTFVQDCLAPDPVYDPFTFYHGFGFSRTPAWRGTALPITSSDSIPFTFDTGTGLWSGTPDTVTDGSQTWNMTIGGQFVKEIAYEVLPAPKAVYPATFVMNTDDDVQIIPSAFQTALLPLSNQVTPPLPNGLVIATEDIGSIKKGTIYGTLTEPMDTTFVVNALLPTVPESDAELSFTEDSNLTFRLQVVTPPMSAETVTTFAYPTTETNPVIWTLNQNRKTIDGRVVNTLLPSNHETFYQFAASLPPELVIDSETGEISGIPQIQLPTTSITVVATSKADGNQYQSTLYIQIQDQEPVPSESSNVLKYTLGGVTGTIGLGCLLYGTYQYLKPEE
jgi:hypothetical protein